MQYLTHDQALADIAEFILYLRRGEYPKCHKIFVVGGSYSGALAARARYKYPHLINGALSSSGVVYAIEDFYQFDEHVKKVVRKNSPECEQQIRNVIKEVEEQWETNPWKFKKAHKAPYFEKSDFEFYFSDIFVETVQYGRGTYLCRYMDEIKDEPNKQERLAELALNNRAAPYIYAYQTIQNIRYNPYQSFRQWTYQFCNSLAYFNSVGPQKDPLRFKDMDLQYWKSYCTKCFNSSIYPDTIHTNSLYGDLRIEKVASRIIFTNAGDDPWQWAGVRR